MNERFLKLARRTCTGVCLAMICGGFTACHDDYDLDDLYDDEELDSLLKSLED